MIHNYTSFCINAYVYFYNVGIDAFPDTLLLDATSTVLILSLLM